MTAGGHVLRSRLGCFVFLSLSPLAISRGGDTQQASPAAAGGLPRGSPLPPATVRVWRGGSPPPASGRATHRPGGLCAVDSGREQGEQGPGQRLGSAQVQGSRVRERRGPGPEAELPSPAGLQTTARWGRQAAQPLSWQGAQATEGGRSLGPRPSLGASRGGGPEQWRSLESPGARLG